MRTLIAGNWTMNGLQAQIAEIAEIAAMARAFADGPSDVEELVCVPATLIAHAAQAADGLLEIGGEDCSAEEAGPFTGDIDAQMLRAPSPNGRVLTPRRASSSAIPSVVTGITRPTRQWRRK